MSKKLLIVESPAKTKTISKYLGNNYIVKSSVGHIRDIPKSSSKKANAIEIENNFKPNYQIIPGKEKIIADLKSAAKKVDEVLLATDPDREGEAIAWHIAEVLKIPQAKRIVFNEITSSAVQNAILHPRAIDQNLRKAQEARRILDRLFGYGLSALIWKKLRYGLSAGRVQSPALRIIMERERLIRAFIPEKFWVITAQVQTKKKEKFILTCSTEPRDKKELDLILKIAKKEQWLIDDIKETKVKKSPRAPFITSTLQQTASSRLGYSPSQTMMHAQKLYEAGLITYMRTDSTVLSSQAQKQAQTIISKNYGPEYYQSRIFKNKSKNAQEAHEAIRPTNLNIKNAGHNPQQQKLYQLIYQRTLASQMSDAQLLRTKIIVKFKNNLLDKKSVSFVINGSRLLFDGWLAIDSFAKNEDLELPKVQKNDILDLLKINTITKETQAPSRYSEASLIKELEKRGLGRPSTYATIVKTLYNRAYVEKENKTLRPTDTGEVVSSFLEKYFANYISDSFTAQMENELDDIANEKLSYVELLTNFYKPFIKDIKDKDSIEKISNLGPAESKYKCPKCGGPMVYKLAKSGKFISCQKYPECKGALTLEGKEIAEPQAIGKKCPQCQDGELVIREGKYGKFISCSNYPKCKYIQSDPEEEKKKLTGVKCPQCQDGEIIERRGRFGIFYSCSNYPKCKYALKARPTGKICDYPRPERNNEKCGALMMVGTKTIPERCSDKTCPNHNPHKLKNKESFK